MLLVLDGRVDLEADVHTYLPALPAYTQAVTVGDLVHHSSGLPDYIGQIDADDEEVTTAADALAVLSDGHDEPAFTPGTEFEYSNTNYFLLGQLVEAVTGRTLVDYAAQQVFRPLGMDHSLFRDDHHDGVLLPGQAAGHAPQGARGWEVVWSDWRQTGDGAVHTTVGDLLRWSGVFLGAPSTEGPGLTGLARPHAHRRPGPRRGGLRLRRRRRAGPLRRRPRALPQRRVERLQLRADRRAAGRPGGRRGVQHRRPRRRSPRGRGPQPSGPNPEATAVSFRCARRARSPRSAPATPARPCSCAPPGGRSSPRPPDPRRRAA